MNIYVKDSQTLAHLLICWQLEKPKKAKKNCRFADVEESGRYVIEIGDQIWKYCGYILWVAHLFTVVSGL
jgi:hypothetical protein